MPCGYSINVFEADLSSSTDLSYMFGNTNVIYVKLTNVRPTKMRGMFFSADLSEIDLSGFDTSAVADMAELFYASNISSIDFSGLDFSNVTNLHSAFAQTPITSVDLSVVDTSKVIHMSDMFSQCNKLKSVVLGDLSSVEYITSVFANCTSLESVTMKGPISENADFGSYPFAGVNTTGTFYYNPAYDYSSIIAKLPATWTAVPLTE